VLWWVYRTADRKYLANYNTANRTLKQLESNTTFVAWLAKTEADNSEQLRGQRLPSLLIQPVQRIPRYRMLLDELLKQYSKFQEADVAGQLEQLDAALDTGDVWLAKQQEQAKIDNAVREMREACAKIGEVANTVNEAIRENERLEVLSLCLPVCVCLNLGLIQQCCTVQELFEIQESMRNLGGRTLMDQDRWLLKRGARLDPPAHCLLRW
jgi:formate dehydrogenase maturation protein FdhE